MKLTERDNNIFATIQASGFATTAQIAKCCDFPNEKVASRRLHMLSKSGGYLYHIERPSEQGKGEYVYYLSPKGLDLTGAKSKTSHAPSLKNLSHTLSINDFVGNLKSACEKNGIRLNYILDSFLREEDRFNKYLQKSGSYLKTMYPDIVFALQNQQGKKALFLVEVEMSTISVKSQYSTSIKEKVLTMAAYFDRYVFHFFNQIFEADFSGFRYLILTAGNRARINKIISACHERDQDFDFVWIAPIEAVSEQSILKCIWRKMNPEDQNQYCIIGNSTLEHKD